MPADNRREFDHVGQFNLVINVQSPSVTTPNVTVPNTEVTKPATTTTQK